MLIVSLNQTLLSYQENHTTEDTQSTVLRYNGKMKSYNM